MGDDGKCEALKAPEICRQTGFLDANTAKAQEDLAIQGASAEAAAIVLLVTASLAVLQTLNYHWHCITSPCWGGCTHCCETFGQPYGCDIGYVVCGCPMECMESVGDVLQRKILSETTTLMGSKTNMKLLPYFYRSLFITYLLRYLEYMEKLHMTM